MWLWWLGCTSATIDEVNPMDSSTELPSTEPLRVATWNIEGLGAPSSDQYVAARAVLQRIDADVVGLNEIQSGEEDNLIALALDLGYDVVQPRTNPFGRDHNAVLSRLPIVQSGFPSSAVLSGDPVANDVTRWPVALTIEAPWGSTVGLAVQHCKSGFDLTDQFRRTVDTTRLGQAAARLEATHRIVMGDLNEDRSELEEEAPTPAQWTFPPNGLPQDFVLGDDIEARLDNNDLPNHPFVLAEQAGFTVITARQRDGRSASRDSGRLIDYVLQDGSLQVVDVEIYDSQDEQIDGGIELSGEPLAREVSRAAADHFPVVVDLRP
ncbi:MAG: endonuclease/exonuclease/phosphatase family protein [Myxococcota bacterium]